MTARPLTCRVPVAINTEHGPASQFCGKPTPCSRHWWSGGCCTAPSIVQLAPGTRMCETCGTVLVAESTAEVAALREALLEYGGHHGYCQSAMVHGGERECVCGFTRALSAGSLPRD